jgi:uncharacterized OB-fold protein
MIAEGFKVFACIECGAADFPRRLMCPRCGSAGTREVAAASGTVEETTVVRRRPGMPGESLVRLATVRTDAGPRVIARLDATMQAGVRVNLRHEADGAITASISQE